MMPDFRYRQTSATLDVRGFEFRAAGRQPIDLGWRAAFPEWQPADEKGDEAQLLPPLHNGETAMLQDPKIENKETRPPPRYNERHSDRGNAKCLAFCRRWGSSGTPEGSQGYWHAGDPSRDHRRIEEAGFPTDTVRRPQYFGILTNDIVYKRLAPGVLDELKRA